MLSVPSKSGDVIDYSTPLKKFVLDSASLLGAQGLYEQQRAREAIDLDTPLAELANLCLHSR